MLRGGANVAWAESQDLTSSSYMPLILLQSLLVFVIPHLEMRACDWSKSRHVTFTKSGYFPHKAILPPFVYVNSASRDQYCLHVQFDFSKQQSEPLD